MTMLAPSPVTAQEWRDRSARRNGPRTSPTSQPVKNSAAPTDAERWEAIIAEIVAFQHLGENWDGLGAAAPSRELLESAVGLAYLLCENGMDAPSAVAPGLDGSVNFEWHAPDGTFCEVEVLRPFCAEVMLIEPGKPVRHWTLPTE